MKIERNIERAARLLKQADGLLIGAGAGIGVDSGLPDFRGNQGFWKAYPPLGRAGISFVEIANPEAFARSPRLAWGFYGHRLQLYRDTVPHDGFRILQELASNMPSGGFVFTSNVDGQFQKAGFDPQRVAEFHGSIHHMQCCDPCSEAIWPADDIKVDVDEEQCLLRSDLPPCMQCGMLARPNILMFDDWAWLSSRTENQLGRMHAWREKVDNLVVIEIGAGIDIPSVRRMGEALRVPLIRVNPAHPEVKKDIDVSLPLGALEAMQRIQAIYNKL